MIHGIFQLSLLPSNRISHREHLETLKDTACVEIQEKSITHDFVMLPEEDETWFIPIEILSMMFHSLCVWSGPASEGTFHHKLQKGSVKNISWAPWFSSLNMGTKRHTGCLKSATLTARERREPGGRAQRAATAGFKVTSRPINSCN